MIKPDLLRSVRRVSLIQVVILQGTGTLEDPFRHVTLLYDDEGHCVAAQSRLVDDEVHEAARRVETHE